MNFSFFKNIPTITFYFASIISFVIANVSKTSSLTVYYSFLGLGLVLFLLGLLKKMKAK